MVLGTKVWQYHLLEMGFQHSLTLVHQSEHVGAFLIQILKGKSVVFSWLTRLFVAQLLVFLAGVISFTRAHFLLRNIDDVNSSRFSYTWRSPFPEADEGVLWHGARDHTCDETTFPLYKKGVLLRASCQLRMIGGATTAIGPHPQVSNMRTRFPTECLYRPIVFRLSPHI